MSAELRQRINGDALKAREAIRNVIEIHGLGSICEEVRTLIIIYFPFGGSRLLHISRIF